MISIMDSRARRMLRRVPHTSLYSALELTLLSVLALQCARLVWVLATPVGPVGDWQVAPVARPPVMGGAELLSSFDPFFRLSGDAGPVVVTSLDLQLFGVRQDRASGRGAAIIGTANGQQRSFVVGEEIAPGVTLTGVGFDSVTISRNGSSEQMFMDQSPPADGAAPVAPIAAQPTPSVAPVVPPSPQLNSTTSYSKADQ